MVMTTNIWNSQKCRVEISDLFFQYKSKECICNSASNRELVDRTEQTWISGKKMLKSPYFYCGRRDISAPAFVSIKLVLLNAAYQHVSRIRGRWITSKQHWHRGSCPLQIPGINTALLLLTTDLLKFVQNKVNWTDRHRTKTWKFK